MGIIFSQGSEILASFQDTFACKFYQNVIPSADNTLDLGTSIKEWRNLQSVEKTKNIRPDLFSKYKQD